MYEILVKGGRIKIQVSKREASHTYTLKLFFRMTYTLRLVYSRIYILYKKKKKVLSNSLIIMIISIILVKIKIYFM